KGGAWGAARESPLFRPPGSSRRRLARAASGLELDAAGNPLGVVEGGAAAAVRDERVVEREAAAASAGAGGEVAVVVARAQRQRPVQPVLGAQVHLAADLSGGELARGAPAVEGEVEIAGQREHVIGC